MFHPYLSIEHDVDVTCDVEKSHYTLKLSYAFRIVCLYVKVHSTTTAHCEMSQMFQYLQIYKYQGTNSITKTQRVSTVQKCYTIYKK